MGLFSRIDGFQIWSPLHRFAPYVLATLCVVRQTYAAGQHMVQIQLKFENRAELRFSVCFFIKGVFLSNGPPLFPSFAPRTREN